MSSSSFARSGTVPLKPFSASRTSLASLPFARALEVPPAKRRASFFGEHVRNFFTESRDVLFDFLPTPAARRATTLRDLDRVRHEGERVSADDVMSWRAVMTRTASCDLPECGRVRLVRRVRLGLFTRDTTGYFVGGALLGALVLLASLRSIVFASAIQQRRLEGREGHCFARARPDRLRGNPRASRAAR